jgi:hypothetical protein
VLLARWWKEPGLRHGFHNIGSVAIEARGFKPTLFKVKLEFHLTIANRQACLLHANACTDQQMHVVDGLYLMRSWQQDITIVNKPVVWK